MNENKKNNKNENEIIFELSITLIKQVVIKLIKEDNNVKDEININIIKLIEKFDGLFKKNKIKKNFFNKFLKFAKFIDSSKTISLRSKKSNKNDEEKILLNNSIIAISICYISNNINCKKHYNIRKYLKIFLFFFVNDVINMNNFFFVIDILLTSIIEILKFKSFNQFQIYDLNDEPLKFINDLLEAIINFPNCLLKNDKFIEHLINLFNKFYERATNINIIIKENTLWFKLLQNTSINNSFEFLEDIGYQNSIKIITSFLIQVYQNNIPKNFYSEIFKRATIDLMFYINSAPILKELIKTDLNKPKKTELDKGVYLLGTNYIKKHLNFPITNEFSFMLPFKIIYTKGNDINLLNLVQKDNIIQISMRESSLVICINKDYQWNTNIKILKNVFYFLIIVYNRKNKLIEIYLNNEEVANNRTRDKRHENKCTYLPKFNKDMDAIIGDNNLYAIFGDIFFFNKELNKQFVKILFDSKGFYSNLIIGNNINSSLVNNLIYSKIYTENKKYFSQIKYEYNLLLTSNLFLTKENIPKNAIIEYNNINKFHEFININGIEFLIFMLHNINSIIPDIKILNKFLSQTLDIIASLLSRENKDIDYIYDIDKNKYNYKIDIFFMTFLSIVKPENDENKKFMKTLSDEVWNSLIDIFIIDFGYSGVYRQIILSILLDNKLFDQKKNIESINTSVLNQIKLEEINDELFYKILAIDFMFELNYINHKNLLNIIKAICTSGNKFFCAKLINYIVKIKNEVKLYHYLKIIYENIKKLIETVPAEIMILNAFVERQFDSYDHFHCKYCSYIIILSYLLKNDINLDKNKKRDEKFSFEFNKYKYISNPSFLFIRCLFIENFELKNIQKLKFIKSKGKKKFNFDVFKLAKHHPFELYKLSKFLERFNNILSYIEYLFNLNQNENLKNIFEYYFPFILEFAEIIKNRYSKNVFIKKDDEKLANIFYSSEGFCKFFILYLKYNKEKAMNEIKNYINKMFFIYMNPFYFKFFNPRFEIIDEYNTFQIRFEIIKEILNTISEYKEQIKERFWNNIFLFLIIIYKYFYKNELNINLPENFHSLLIALFKLLLNNKMLLHSKLLNLLFFEEVENSENNILVCELILDMILKFFFSNHYESEEIISLITESKNSIFYNKDDRYLKLAVKKNKEIEFNEDSDKDIDMDEDTDNAVIADVSDVDFDDYTKILFKEELKDFSFCLYFLIYFLEKESLCMEQNEKSCIKKILEMIFKDLKTLFRSHKKIAIQLKKMKNFGKNYEVYNEMLEICITNKNNFSLEFLSNKYHSLNNQIKNEKEKEKIKENKLDESKINETSIDNYNTTNDNSKENETNNQSLKKDIEVEIKKEENENKNKLNIVQNEENVNADYFMKKELSKINTSKFYLNLFIKDKDSEESLRALFNPKYYLIWNKLSFVFKDYIFFNKKFKNVELLYKIHLNSAIPNKKFEFTKSDEYYLNYPSKIRNYIVDDYYRPFLKPYLNFFSNDYLHISHKYVNKNLLNDFKYKQDYFNSINYNKLIPTFNKEKYYCELIKNKGNIFGYIELNEKCFIFKNSPNDDPRSSDDIKKSFKFIFSIKDDKIIDTKKFTMIFYHDIKEIIKRRICLLYIGLEIFMKDNRSYMFNFFDKSFLNRFIEDIKKYTSEYNNKIFKSLNSSPHIMEVQNHPDKNNKSTDNINKSTTLPKINQIKQEIDFKLIDDPINELKKLHLTSKNKKGELSNFNYLLLINKYSSRTYNDYNQYLVFPLLFMDEENKRKRDLSKVIALNKENNQNSIDKALNNYSLFKYHFNQHYSTAGFILYYLVRLIPFTFQHILFQSMKFDVPARIFSSMKNIFLFYEVTEDNRELIPEFFCSYDFLINLNCNDLGVLDIQNENYHLNNVDVIYKYSYPEFIIKSRNLLDEADLSPWIDLIFGPKQTIPSNDPPNLFALNSFEENSKLEKIKEEDIPLEEKRKKISDEVELLKFGVSPAKLFNKLHDKMGKKYLENNEDDIDINDNIDKKDEKCLNVINKYITKKIKEKALFYYINTRINNEIEIIFKFTYKIDIFKLKLGDTKPTEFSLKIQEQLDFEPYSNSFIEIFPSTYCIVRHIDNTISFVSTKKVISIYQFNCLVSAVEHKYNKNAEDKSYKEIFIGDEKGFLHLIEIHYEYNHYERTYEILNINLKKSIKIFESYIKGLLHIERLNIIISWSDENEKFISINNDYSLEVLNIIKFENKIDIQEILVSKYDLIFISCVDNDDIYNKYKVYCYSLNGMKISLYEINQKIIKCFIDEYISVIHLNNNGFIYYLYSFEEPKESFYCDFTKDSKALNSNIRFCQYYPKNKKYLMISSNNKAAFFCEDKND